MNKSALIELINMFLKQELYTAAEESCSLLIKNFPDEVAGYEFLYLIYSAHNKEVPSSLAKEKFDSLKALSPETFLTTINLLKNQVSGVFYNKLNLEYKKLLTRRKAPVNLLTSEIPIKLHIGCGQKLIKDWVNIDLDNSNLNLDISCSPLPFHNNSVDVIVAQHVVEHLQCEDELPFFFSEISRIITPQGTIWLSFPDLAKLCQNYLSDKGTSLLKNRQKRFPHFHLNGQPVQHILNDIFYQSGEHVYMLDYELVSFYLNKAGITLCSVSDEPEFLAYFPEFPQRMDDDVSLYVRCKK